MFRKRKTWGMLALLAAGWMASTAHGAPYEPTDEENAPASMDVAIAAVQKMKDADPAGSTQQMAQYLSRVIDKRITNGNSPEGWLATANPLSDSATKRFDRERDTLGAEPGTDYAVRAKWAWNLQYGCCAEAACIAYFILDKAGVPARIVEYPGHDYVLIGLAPGADITDANTWGKGAFIVDGWFGVSTCSVPAIEFITNRAAKWVGSNYWGPLKDAKRYDATVSFASEGQHKKFLESGYLVGKVVDADTQAPIAGAQVVITGKGGSIRLEASKSGEFSWGGVAGKYAAVASHPPKSSINRQSPETTIDIKGKRAKTEVTLAIPGPRGFVDEDATAIDPRVETNQRRVEEYDATLKGFKRISAAVYVTDKNKPETRTTDFYWQALATTAENATNEIKGSRTRVQGEIDYATRPGNKSLVANRSKFSDTEATVNFTTKLDNGKFSVNFRSWVIYRERFVLFYMRDFSLPRDGDEDFTGDREKVFAKMREIIDRRFPPEK